MNLKESSLYLGESRVESTYVYSYLGESLDESIYVDSYLGGLLGNLPMYVFT